MGSVMKKTFQFFATQATRSKSFEFVAEPQKVVKNINDGYHALLYLYNYAFNLRNEFKSPEALPIFKSLALLGNSVDEEASLSDEMKQLIADSNYFTGDILANRSPAKDTEALPYLEKAIQLKSKYDAKDLSESIKMNNGMPLKDGDPDPIIVSKT